MNEDSIRKLNVSLTVHYKTLKRTKERGVYLVHDTECMNPSTPLIFYKMDQVKTQFDMNERMNEWLMSQINTYSVEQQAVYGIIVEKRMVLSHVVNIC